MKCKTARYINFGFHRFYEEAVSPVIKRLTVLIMIAALLLPMIVFEPMMRVSAKTNAPKENAPAPAAEPPLPFTVSSPNDSSFIPPVVSSVVSSAFSPAANFFTAPELPLGFSAARTASPASVYFSRFASVIGNTFSFLGSSVSPTASASNPPANGVEFDYDADGKADPAVWHQQTGNWKIKKSSDGTTATVAYGATAAYMTPGDFDGDSVSDIAIFDQGTWAVYQSSTSTTVYITLGASGDRPVSGDFDGDGKSDAAVFRPSNGNWIVKQSSSGNTVTTQWGISTDTLVPADFDGDGKTDLAVFRPSVQLWYILGSSVGYYSLSWGLGSDLPVPADYDGDGKADLAVFRPSTGTWFALKSSSSTGEYIAQAWGNYNDQPVPADYDGDSKTDFAVYRPKTGVWHILKSSDWGYQAHTLGVSTDKLAQAAYLKQNGSVVFDNNFARTRLAPRNATGGTNLYSQNFSWGTGLVGLPGRAGMDAGFGISYNSLVWIKHNNTMVFDPDFSNVSPGFRMGFPTIEPIHYDATTQKYTYMMMSPSGARTEFRQTLVSNVYETADSSYLQLTANGATSPNDPAENVTLTIRGTDGTQMNYEFKGGAYHPSQIKDRNGNYITIAYDDYGLLQTVTDTLGRVVTVNYDAENSPTTITQQWKDNNGAGSALTRTYATFSYTAKTVTPGFASGIGIYGPNGLQVKVLDKIVYGSAADNTGETRFEYNDFGQVKKIRNYAKDQHELNYTATNLDTPGTNLTDVPRLSQTRSWVENFNGIGGIPSETVVTNSLQTGHQVTNIDGQTVTASVIQVAMQNHPHGNITNSYVGESGWMEGLPIRTDDYANGSGGLELKRSSWTKWTQDDTNASYIVNPRATASKIGDDVSTRKTEIDYKMKSGSQTVSDTGLVSEVRLYDAATSTLLKKSTTVYNENSAYLSRRIIGLPGEQNLYDGNNALMSKATFAYDEGDFTDSGLQQNISPIQHDSTNYGASFIVGRGNLTSVTRHDVSNSATVSSSQKYNTAGAMVAGITPWTSSSTRTIKINYEDNFNDGNNSRNTYAYPKTVTDAGGFSSTVKYRFDTGANVEATSPTPHGTGNSSGKKTTRIYDSFGRLEKETIANTGAYTRYQHFDNGVRAKIFATITAGAGEAETEIWTDGAGRTLRSRSELPGSNGGWSGGLTEYDQLGRIKRSSVPTEVSVNESTQVWTPAGDDASRGWLWQSQEYDWQSRVTKKINTDGTFQTAGYEGCGCSGGLVTTIRGEEIFETAWDGTNPTSLGRRTQKIYEDVLGRTKKTEVLNWDDTVYSTTVVEYDGRDQAVSVKKYAGTTSSSTFQETTMTYDEFGRMATQHRPEQIDANNDPTYTTYNYNPDGSISTVVDGRGAATNYAYNSRGAVEEISYSAPTGSNIPVPATVEFEYDDAGNRKKMTDGLGTVDYTYTELSQLKTEKRTFNDTLADAPAGNNAFLLTYDYTLSGQLKYITDPYGQQFNYTYDEVGRLTQVAGSTAFDGISVYAQNPTYNARGTLTSLQYGNGVSMNLTGFNNKLQATGFEVKKGTDKYIEKEYKFYEDGSLKFIDDALNEKFDRSYKYDHLGRTVEGKAGIAARGGTSQDQYKLDQPYSMTYTHDAFGHITSMNGYYYSSQDNNTYSYNTKNRNPNWTYDTDGNTTIDTDASYTYDAAGRIVKTNDGSVTDDYFDGDGHLLKRVTNIGSTENETKHYYIRSSALGKVISETYPSGKKHKTFVPANGTILATQTVYLFSPYDQLTFNHTDASGTGAQRTTAAGALFGDTDLGRTGEYSPMGRNVADMAPYIDLMTVEPPNEGGTIDLFGTGQGYRPGKEPFKINGVIVPAAQFMVEIESGLIGGAFGLLEIATRMSAYKFAGYTLRTDNGTIIWGGWDIETAMGRMEGGETIIRNWFVNDSWSVNLTLISFQVLTLPKSLFDVATVPHPDIDKLKDRVEDRLKNKNGDNKSCKEALDQFLKQLGKDSFDAVAKNFFEGLDGRSLLQTKEEVPLIDVLVEDTSFVVGGSKEYRPGYVSGETSQNGKSIVINKLQYNQQGGGSFTFIHEILHVAGGGHEKLAKAIAKFEGVEKAFGKYKKKNKLTDGNYSNFINSWLGKYCTQGGGEQWNEWLKRIQ